MRKRYPNYGVDWRPLETTVSGYARKISYWVSVDWHLNRDARNQIYSLIFNSLWEPLQKEIYRDRKRRKAQP